MLPSPVLAWGARDADHLLHSCRLGFLPKVHQVGQGCLRVSLGHEGPQRQEPCEGEPLVPPALHQDVLVGRLSPGTAPSGAQSSARQELRLLHHQSEGWLCKLN